MDKAIKKKLADASILKAKRALDACHVMVLLLDAPRLLTVKQVRCRAVDSPVRHRAVDVN